MRYLHRQSPGSSVLALLTALVLAGCGGASAAKQPPAPRPRPQPLVRTFTYAENGRVVTLAIGRRAVVKLPTLNWTFQSITGYAVRAVGPQRLVYVTKGCNAPNGCGSVQLAIEGVARGRSVIGAERGSCGEASRCPPDLRKYSVKVVVN